MVKHAEDAVGSHLPVELVPFAVIEAKPRTIRIRSHNPKKILIVSRAPAVLPLNSGEARNLPGCKSPVEKGRLAHCPVLNDRSSLALERDSLREGEFGCPFKCAAG